MSSARRLPFSTDQLLAIAQKYWPSHSEFIPIHHTSPERERLQDLWEQKRKALDPWNDFIGVLKKELSDFLIIDVITTADASLRFTIHRREGNPPPAPTQVVVGCVSILAPVYAMYGVSYEPIGRKRHNVLVNPEPSPSMNHPARIAAQMIERVFGASALPHEVTQTPVPLFVGLKEPPKTTLFHALFTSEPSSIPWHEKTIVTWREDGSRGRIAWIDALIGPPPSSQTK